MALGSKLKELRVHTGESLQKVADAVGASKAHIWELETGRSKNPSIELVTALARHFDVPVSSLIGENPDAAGEDTKLVAMYRDFKGLTENDRATIRTFMKALREQSKERK